MSESDATASADAISGQTRTLLSAAATRHLEATGEGCFRIVSRGHAEQPGRWGIHLAPCPIKFARAAESVLFGKSSAVPVTPDTPETVGHPKDSAPVCNRPRGDMMDA